MDIVSTAPANALRNAYSALMHLCYGGKQCASKAPAAVKAALRDMKHEPERQQRIKQQLAAPGEKAAAASGNDDDDPFSTPLSAKEKQTLRAELASGEEQGFEALASGLGL